MGVNLPGPIAIYFAAQNQAHTEIVPECFAENAVVRDEGKRWKVGRDQAMDG